MQTITTIALALAAVLCAVDAIKINSCSRNSGGNKAKILILDVNPDPVALPGKFSVGGTVEILEDLDGVFSGELSVKKKSSLSFLPSVPLPCVESEFVPGLRVGTCHYDNLCADLDKLYTRVKNETGTAYCEDITFPCSCPIPKGVYKLPPYEFEIDHLNAALSLFSDGSYEILVAIKNEATGEEVACYKGEATIGAAVYHNQTVILEHPVVSGGPDLPFHA